MKIIRRTLPIASLLAITTMSPAQLQAQLQDSKPIPQSTDHPVPAIQDTETPAQRDARMAWWREARFGMFIHWGLYSIPAGTWNGKRTPRIGEWIMNDLSIPVADYKALAPQFNPTGFSAHDIVALAKSAGMKYIVITAKHHDGFAMFDSKADPFNIVAATPFKRDPLKELAAECRKQGIKLGFYYSQDQDWTAPGGAALKTGDHQPPTYHWDKAQDGDFATYLHTKAIPQLKELLTNYGDFPAVIWFDTPTERHDAPARAAEIVALLNKHPNLIWNNRLGGGYKGDTETPEQFIPPQGYPGRDWESCMTMNDTWGYKSYDTNFKSTETLIRNLIDIASKGGNYLLNIGPDSHGIVPQPEVERLHQVGQWTRRQRRSHLRHQAHPLRRRSRQLQHHRKRQERQAQVHPLLELALHHRPQQNLHRDLQLAAGHIPPRQPPTQRNQRLPARRQNPQAPQANQNRHWPRHCTPRQSPRPHRHRPRPQHFKLAPKLGCPIHRALCDGWECIP